MTKLAELVREHIGKGSDHMVRFFQRMVKDGELNAYSVQIDRTTVDKDTEDEKVIRIKKGATLTPITELGKSKHIFVEDVESEVMYNFCADSWGGHVFEDGPQTSQTKYHFCALERLAQGFDLRKIKGKPSCIGPVGSDIDFPEGVVVSRLRINYKEDWQSGSDSDYFTGSKGDFSVEGEMDGLFEKVCEFVRSG